MAYSYYLNYEKVATEIIEQQLECLTDNNVVHDEKYDFDVIDEKSFYKNLKAGSIALMFINILFETTLNTILRRKNLLEENKDKSVDKKLETIGEVYKLDLKAIKSGDQYCVYQNARKIRDDITHFKWNELGASFLIHSHIRLNLGKKREYLADIFTKKYIQKSYRGVLDLIELICSQCGLAVNKEVQIIDCDGRTGAYEYIKSIDTLSD